MSDSPSVMIMKLSKHSYRALRCSPLFQSDICLYSKSNAYLIEPSLIITTQHKELLTGVSTPKVLPMMHDTIDAAACTIAHTAELSISFVVAKRTSSMGLELLCSPRTSSGDCGCTSGRPASIGGIRILIALQQPCCKRQWKNLRSKHACMNCIYC